jgi:hypothetical protein
MKEFFIKSILSFIFSITGAQWRQAIDYVRKLAAVPDITNEQRAVRFLGWFIGSNPGLKTWVAETVRNLAVGYARKKKWITP